MFPDREETSEVSHTMSTDLCLEANCALWYKNGIPNKEWSLTELWRNKSEFREPEAAGSCGYSSGGEGTTEKKNFKGSFDS